MYPKVEESAPYIESLLGYIFTNKRLCMEAVQMSAPQIALSCQGTLCTLENNKRLSVLGDAILTKVLCGAWFKARDYQGKAYSLAQWTQVRNDMLANDALAQRGLTIGIDACVITADTTTTVSRKMVATALEALVGAVWQDGGDEAVDGVMKRLGFFEHGILAIPPWPSP